MARRGLQSEEIFHFSSITEYYTAYSQFFSRRITKDDWKRVPSTHAHDEVVHVQFQKSLFYEWNIDKEILEDTDAIGIAD